MKKVLVALVAVAVCFVGTVYSADTATTKTTTVGGTTITKEASKVTTPEATVKEKAKSVTTGDTTVTTAKEVVDYKSTNITPGDVVREKVTIKQYNENNPNDKSDDTLTVITDKKETMTWKLDKNFKRDNLQKNINKEVVFSTYKIGPEQYVKDFDVPTTTTTSTTTKVTKEVAPKTNK